MIKLSVIVPIGLTIDTIFRAKRLRYLVELFSKREGIEIIVVDSSRFPLSKIISSIDGISYHHIEMGSIYSASKGEKFWNCVAKGNYLLFFDVDLVANLNFIDNIFSDIDRLSRIGLEAFTIYPSLY